MKARRMIVLAGLIALSAGADAQLLGGRAGVGAGVGVPSVGGTLDGAARATGDLAARTADSARVPSVSVRAGASTRVDRGTRCYYQPDDYYYEPVYRDGYYYCEQRGGVGASASASVATPR